MNRLEALIRQINPQLSLHYWDWTQDPRAIPNANLGGGTTGSLNLFTSDFMVEGLRMPRSVSPGKVQAITYLLPPSTETQLAIPLIRRPRSARPAFTGRRSRSCKVASPDRRTPPFEAPR